jgi:replicative DNA helicase
MDKQLLKAIKNHEFYSSIQSNLSRNLFEDEMRDIYDAIVEGHTKYGKDLSSEDVLAIWLKTNPVATRAERNSIEDAIDSVDKANALQTEVAEDLLKELWKRNIGHKIANLGIEITEGVDSALVRLEELLHGTREGLLPNDFGETTTKDIEELLAKSSDDARWQFNISTLSRHVYGIGPAEFGVVFATPETGKSAFMISMCAGPGGFCEQGAKVLYIANEEESTRTMLRAIQSWGGMTREEIAADPRSAKNRFSAIADRIEMKDTQDWDLAKIESYIETMKPDVVIIDQADKVHINGMFNAGHERIRELYRSLREVAKRQQVALIGVSQASADAKGKTRLSPFEMEGSKIGKAAETDLIIGIGKHEATDVDDTEPDYTRYLTVSKNKLSGWHGTVICQIQPAISRYVE